MANWALMPHFLNAQRGKLLAGDIGCETYDVDEMMKCLYNKSAHDIIRGTEFSYVSPQKNCITHYSFLNLSGI